jgi:hypothetical protein
MPLCEYFNKFHIYIGVMQCLIGNRPQTTVTWLLKEHMAHYQMQVELLYFRWKKNW